MNDEFYKIAKTSGLKIYDDRLLFNVKNFKIAAVILVFVTAVAGISMFAEVIGFRYTAVSNYESGCNESSIDVFAKLMKLYISHIQFVFDYMRGRIIKFYNIKQYFTQIRRALRTFASCANSIVISNSP